MLSLAKNKLNLAKISLRHIDIVLSWWFNSTFSLLGLQNIEQGKTYKVVFYIRSTGSIDVDVSLTSSNGGDVLATINVA